MRWTTLIPLLVIGVTGAGAWSWWSERPASANLPPAKPAAVPVETAAARREDIPVYLTGLGTVQALNTVTVTARVDGQLQKIAFTEGQDVKAGDVLAQIDPRTFQAALDQAVAKKAEDTATLKNAQLDLARDQDLDKKGFATRQQLDTQRALVTQTTAAIQGDQATIDSARTELDYTTIRSPIDGRTGFRLVDQGNNVHATDTTGIVVITQVHPISVVFTLPEENLGAVTQAMAAGPVEATALDRDNKTVLGQGKIELADNVIDQSTGTARFKAEFPNADDKLWPGGFVNVRVLLETRHDALTIPSAAVETGPEGPFAYVVKPDTTIEARKIGVGSIDGATAVIDNGLGDGEQVVTAGQYRLEPGIAVQTASAGAAPTSAASTGSTARTATP